MDIFLNQDTIDSDIYTDDTDTFNSDNEKLDDYKYITNVNIFNSIIKKHKINNESYIKFKLIDDKIDYTLLPIIKKK